MHVWVIEYQSPRGTWHPSLESFPCRRLARMKCAVMRWSTTYNHRVRKYVRV